MSPGGSKNLVQYQRAHAGNKTRAAQTVQQQIASSLQWHRVMWSTPPPSFKILRLSVLELWVLTYLIGYHWQCVCSHCACAISRDLCAGGKFFPHIWNPWPRFAYSLYNFYGATTTFKGHLLLHLQW